MSRISGDIFASSASKTRVTVLFRGKEETISWFDHTPASEIERLMRQVFDIPPTSSLLLRDLDGDAVVISSRLPDSGRFYLFSFADKFSGSSPTKPMATPSNTPARPPTSAPSYFSSSALAASLSRGYQPAATSSGSGTSPAFPFTPSTPARDLPTSYSPSPQRNPLSFSFLQDSPPVLSSPTSSRPSTTRDALTASLVASSIKEALKTVDKLKNFERRVRELRTEKFEDYFFLDDNGRFCWKRIVPHSEFMSAISSDLYYCAGSCGLLASRKKKDVDAILSSALAAYMEAVRDLGRQGNFDPITSADPSFARKALQGAYEAVISMVQELIREKLIEESF